MPPAAMVLTELVAILVDQLVQVRREPAIPSARPIRRTAKKTSFALIASTINGYTPCARPGWHLCETGSATELAGRWPSK